MIFWDHVRLLFPNNFPPVVSATTDEPCLNQLSYWGFKKMIIFLFHSFLLHLSAGILLKQKIIPFSSLLSITMDSLDFFCWYVIINYHHFSLWFSNGPKFERCSFKLSPVPFCADLTVFEQFLPWFLAHYNAGSPSAFPALDLELAISPRSPNQKPRSRHQMCSQFGGIFAPFWWAKLEETSF